MSESTVFRAVILFPVPHNTFGANQLCELQFVFKSRCVGSFLSGNDSGLNMTYINLNKVDSVKPVTSEAGSVYENVD